MGALLGVAASVIILIQSNGQPTKKWSLQPTVYLAIASTITNIVLHFALTEGVTVAWWRRATKENTTIADLHRHWSYGDSLWAALMSGRHINMVAVASILVAIVPINGPLLQRASRVSLGQFKQDTDLSITIAQQLPDGYTGYLSGRGEQAALLTSAFTSTVNAANSQADINATSTGCSGRCATTIRGAGFAINCSVSTLPFSLTPVSPAPGQNFDNGQQAMANGTQVFGTHIYWGFSEPGTIHLGVQYKNSPACDGELQIRNCTMQSAVVDYPVIVNGNQSTIQLDPSTTMFDDTVLNLTTVTLATMAGPTTLGGFYKALSDTYNSMANLRFAGAVNYELTSTGATVNRYAILNSKRTSYADCTLAFADPSSDLIKAIRDLMFRTAIAATNGSDPQLVKAQETTTLPIYQSHYLYLGLAVLFTALGWLATVPIFIGWWHVGRTVSLSPIETAKAFRAPMLDNADSNGDVDVLLKELGDRPVRYGAAATSGSQMDRLEMSEPQFVRTPHPEQTFVG